MKKSAVIKARALLTDWEPSEVAEAKYHITGRVASPKFSLKPGMYTTEQTVRLDCPTTKAQIFFTTDRSEPTEDSTPYKDPIQLAESSTLSARAYKTGWAPSDIVSAFFE
ncbi:MAG: chitobiase/beta-hexosaminidase C-terminal domain-containing protein, partial [Deltaproteobacteria bacterium]|nr:chitobiase/beta-hexosaminidase C-terminal domain-containing protein [Deltaproteobacteria bacterium]